MKEFETVDDVLDFAISEEEQAHRFYMELAEKATNAHMKKAFGEFAQEELRHKKKLQAVKEGKHLPHIGQTVHDLKIADYLVDIDPDEVELDYSKALVIAMKKEKAAFKLYTDLAEMSDNEELAATFLELAQEEARHKLRFEIEYDDNVLNDW